MTTRIPLRRIRHLHVRGAGVVTTEESGTLELDIAGGGAPGPHTHDEYATDADLSAHVAAGDPHGVYALDTDLTTHAASATAHVQTTSHGGVLLDPSGARDVMVWRAPFACTVINVRAHRKGGTGAAVNARRNQGGTNHLAADLSLTSADTWMDGGAVQDTAYAAGDDLEIRLVSIAGAVTEVAIQVDFTRP